MSTGPSAAPTPGLTAPSVGSRLDALTRSGLLDSPAEGTFDAITRAAAQLLDVPIALLSLVDAKRVFFKSIHGLGEPWATSREAPLSHTLCEHVVKSGDVVAVANFERDIDPRYHPGLLALGGVAYLGVPLRSVDGLVLGTLCAIDTKPKSFEPEQMRTLAALAEVAAVRIEERRDVAAQLKGDGPLRESERLHRLLVDAACDAMLLADSAGRIVAANPAACAMFGHTPEAMLALTMTDLDPDEPNPPAPLRFDVLKAGKKMLRAERRMQRADGTLIVVEASARVVDDGRLLVVARDVSERKHTEEGLRQSEKRLRTALASARMSDWEWDIGAGTIAMSPAAQSLHGIADSAFESFQSSIHADDRAHVFRALKQAVEEGGAFRVDYRTAAAEPRCVALRAGAICDEAGHTVRMVGVCWEQATEN